MGSQCPAADYRPAVDYLLSLVDHERQAPSLPRQKRIYDLRRVSAFLVRLGEPHLSALTVHVAGTKGKGSTAAMVDSILRAAGYGAGFYSSPHLHTFRERIRLGGEPASEDVFAGLVAKLAPAAARLEQETDLGPVTLFEFMTAMAFQCFAAEGVDFQTVEVGLGGKLDATNVVEPAVCAITSVSLDHMAILGDTVEEIAADKAGIIKPGVPVVVAPQGPGALDVIMAAAREKQAPVTLVGRDITWKFRGRRPGRDGAQLTEIIGRRGNLTAEVPLLGRHQLENVAVAVAVADTLAERGHTITEPAIVNGLKNVKWPCRLEVLARNPLVICDGAHNVYSMETMLSALREYFEFERLLVLAGFSRDKSVEGMINALAPYSDVVISTRSRHPRSLAPASLVKLLKDSGVDVVRQAEDVCSALELAKNEAGAGDLILATGSLFVAAEARETMLGIEPELYPDLLPPDLR
jgi:dihydrofolate synthase/folylpolyglutamate synthase